MKRLSGVVAFLLLALIPAPAPADEPAPSIYDRLDLGGSVRAGYWTSDRKLTDERNFTPVSVWLKAAPDLGDGFGARVEGWLYDERPAAGRRPNAELREGLLSWRGESVDFTLGRRIVAWGRADRINPTDVVGSRDYTLLFTDDADQRRGSLMATGAYGFGDYTATIYWLPEFRPNIYPILQPAGVEVTEQGGGFNAAQGALRLDRTGGAVDWAVYYFDGVDRDPDFRITGLGPSSVSVSTVHRRRRMIGVDFATNIGEYGLRGEIAYNLEPSPAAADAFDQRSFLAAVVGVDRNVAAHLNVNVQYLLHRVTDYADPRTLPDPTVRAVAVRGALLDNQLERTQHGITVRVAYAALNETLTLEVAAGGYFTDGSAFVRPKVSYAITDNVKVIAGLDLFFGDELSFFGQLRRNRTTYLELRYGF